MVAKLKKMSNRSLLNLIIFASIIIVVVLTVFNMFVVTPSFSGLIIKNTEIEAIRIGHYLSNYINVSGNITKQLPVEFKYNVLNALIDLNLIKIKVFSSDGEVVFSTSEEDVGMINEKDYFRNIVAKGNVYTKLVRKDTKSLEDQVMPRDVVETYVPIVNSGNFTGAFEIYFDITDTLKDLNKRLFRVLVLMMALSSVLLMVIVGIFFFAHRSLLKREFAEKELEK